MATYTVEIQGSNEDRTIWQALAPAENIVTDAWGANWTAEDVANTTLDNQTLIDITPESNGLWRIVVWAGSDADTGAEASHVLDGQTWLDEQADLRDLAEDQRTDH